MPQRTFLCRLIFCAVFSVSIINVFTKASSPSFFLRYFKPEARLQDDIFCSQSEIAGDVLVVLRTGATESHAKLPVHFKTTLRCVPNFLVVSDLDEEIDGHAVHDVLGGVSEQTKQSSEDFKLYRRLQKQGKRGLGDQQVITAQSGSSKGDYLNTENEGWKLDKWKFLPMIDEAYQHMPNAKWFVFIESDTYLVWNNLLEYLSNFDASKPYYIGKHLYINDIEFGYGGAGFVLSNPAMRKVSEHRSVRIRDYEDFTSTHWVGDCALGKVFEDIKIPLHKAFPHLQGDSPATLDPATDKIGRNAWCYPVVTYHHVSPAEIEELWEFEQNWFKKHDVLLRHRDIFMEHVRPQIRASIPEWDNMSADKEFNAHDHGSSANPLERNSWKSFDHCFALCESKKECVQFSFDSGSCSISFAFRLGYAKPKRKIASGWMPDRIDSIFQELESKCGVRDWFGPNEGSAVKRRR
ncbi:glycosyltransferase family 31 protein [Aaosphaeria arxii CBS 175.79]|uniref:N-acetylgalactosaminide beta-1,3-galactosyltransferase n=1 Tax=Aaosphaeria arxii CBS 175.79 TaxID=1450172 RepID=A0A6A5XY13_9PLEO|nr:glycosyltransferase family 31 protein [Aaosphaeria arxii CBS 175.79]KAF2017717.1 glycosyltransferase family 31 protein [Aaosphaeria arxii CBS 175.79]